jgi:hypothetical protein
MAIPQPQLVTLNVTVLQFLEPLTPIFSQQSELTLAQEMDQQLLTFQIFVENLLEVGMIAVA